MLCFCPYTLDQAQQDWIRPHIGRCCSTLEMRAQVESCALRIGNNRFIFEYHHSTKDDVVNPSCLTGRHYGFLNNFIGSALGSDSTNFGTTTIHAVPCLCCKNDHINRFCQMKVLVIINTDLSYCIVQQS